MQLEKNQILTATVVDLNSQGSGVVKVDGYPLFVEGALPGEEVKIGVTRLNKKYGFARLIEVLKESPDRVIITDSIGNQTGTMTLQHLSYPAQLQFKKNQVQSAFQRIGGFRDIVVSDTIGMENPWGYRNKAQIPVREINGQLETGFYRKRSHDLIPVENYYIQDPEIDKIILIIRDILRDLSVPAYNEDTHTGVIRHIIVKRGHYSREVMVVLVTNGDSLPSAGQLVSRITDEVPGLVSLVQNIQDKKTNVILGKDNRLMWGQDYYSDQMLGMDFKIGVHSFYQVNTPQAERLYQEAINRAELSGDETVLDAYCGIGSISIALAREAGEVYAMEIVDEAVEFARENAELNGIENVHFETGKAEDWLPRWNDSGIKFDVIVVDPPRKGLDENFIKAAIDQNPKRIVYVSCNPQTQARDCKMFAEAGYKLGSVQPVDLFPMTTHIESVALLVK